MEPLNFHHLRYFWAVAKEGSVTRAAERLAISQPTVSSQVRDLEESLGEKLLEKRGRGVVLTEAGRVVFRYAGEIFDLGDEMVDTLKGRPSSAPLQLRVGLANVIPKLVAHRILEPVLQMSPPVHLTCVEDQPDRLLASLAVHDIDVVIADAPVPPTVKVRAYNHLLCEWTIVFFGTADQVRAHRRRFPKSLDGAPMLLPTENTALRRALDHWFQTHGLRPRVVAEFEDSALLGVFGQKGQGVFPAPALVASEVERQYGVRRLGAIADVRGSFYAISVERRIKHPAVAVLSQAAQAWS